MRLKLCDLKDLELQELSDQKSKAVIGGKLFGCIVGTLIAPMVFPVSCKLVSDLEDKIDYS